MRILFLDFDGVLNNGRNWGENALPCAVCARESGRCWFDSEAVRRTNVVLARTGAKIVVSSSWRLGRTIDELRELLYGHGITNESVIDSTQHPFELEPGRWSRRGHEIARWVERCGVKVESFAIVDDDADMVHLTPRLVRTDFETGLLDEHVEQLCALLTEQSA